MKIQIVNQLRTITNQRKVGINNNQTKETWYKGENQPHIEVTK